MFCSRCGKQMDGGAFCSGCGACKGDTGGVPGEKLLLVTGIILIVFAGLNFLTLPMFNDLMNDMLTDAIRARHGGGWGRRVELSTIGWFALLSHLALMAYVGIMAILHRKDVTATKKLRFLGWFLIDDTAFTWFVIYWIFVGPVSAIFMTLFTVAFYMPVMVPYLVGVKKNKEHHEQLSLASRPVARIKQVSSSPPPKQNVPDLHSLPTGSYSRTGHNICKSCSHSWNFDTNGLCPRCGDLG